MAEQLLCAELLIDTDLQCLAINRNTKLFEEPNIKIKEIPFCVNVCVISLPEEHHSREYFP